MATLVISCSDGRLTPVLDELQAALGERHADRLLVPGGPLPLAGFGVEYGVALDQVRLLVTGHDLEAIDLVAHEDCAAYAWAHGGIEAQRDGLARDLQQVRGLLERTFPWVTVRCHLIPQRTSHTGTSFGPAELIG